MTESICRFIDNHQAPDVIHTINFVYECKEAEKIERVSAVYKIGYVVKGDGVVVQNGVEKSIKKCNVFFIFPASTYAVYGNDLEYIYVSFLGLRANILLERAGITKSNFIFEVDDGVGEFWMKNITLPTPVSDISSESVVLYTLSVITSKVLSIKNTYGEEDRFLSIKKYIDDNFSDQELTLNRLSKLFSYNPKYLSGVFMRRFKVGISKYLSLVRVNHACALMDKNYSGVSDIAYLCGFKDPLYFSKVFKAYTGMSPREYIKSNRLTSKIQ